MAALPQRLFTRVLSVVVFDTLNTMRICRWSCRSSPTPASSWKTGMPSFESSAPGPTPDSCSSCGVPMAPAARITALRALAVAGPCPSAT